MGFWTGLLIGLFVGATIAIFFFSVISANKDEADEKYRNFIKNIDKQDKNKQDRNEF